MDDSPAGMMFASKHKIQVIILIGIYQMGLKSVYYFSIFHYYTVLYTYKILFAVEEKKQYIHYILVVTMHIFLLYQPMFRFTCVHDPNTLCIQHVKIRASSVFMFARILTDTIQSLKQQCGFMHSGI